MKEVQDDINLDSFEESCQSSAIFFSLLNASIKRPEGGGYDSPVHRRGLLRLPRSSHGKRAADGKKNGRLLTLPRGSSRKEELHSVV